VYVTADVRLWLYGRVYVAVCLGARASGSACVLRGVCMWLYVCVCLGTSVCVRLQTEIFSSLMPNSYIEF
jgi:hypothetical protein